jgi:HD superfamily phosphodiesterase
MILMDLTQQILSAEKKYKKRLEDFFTVVFSSTNLSSHGLDHHQRVWSYGKELLNQPDIGSLITDTSIPEKLIISCYLHDSGMSIDPGPRHGAQSRVLCEQFIRKYKLPEDEFIEALNAIENHDAKEFSFSDQPGELLTILSVADDLDAFGFIGIFRYLEIYLTRRIPIRDLGYLIIENVAARYEYFMKIFGFDQTLIEKHSSRYQIIISFFNDYNKQCKNYQFDTPDPSGFCGVAEIIQSMIKRNLTPVSLYSFVKKLSDEKVLNWYFSELKKELHFVTPNHYQVI